MAFAVLGTVPGARIRVDDLACAAVSFPGFPEALRAASAGGGPREGRRHRDRWPVGLGQVQHGAGGGRGARVRPPRLGRALPGVTLVALREAARAGPRGPDPLAALDAETILRAAEDRGLMLQPDGAGFAAYLEGEPVDAEIRGAEVTAHVSAVSAVPVVREWINTRLRAHGPRRAGTWWWTAGTSAPSSFPTPTSRSSSPRHRRPARGGGSASAGAAGAGPARGARRRRSRGPGPAPIRRGRWRRCAPADDAVPLDTTGHSFAEQVRRIVELARPIFGRP